MATAAVAPVSRGVLHGRGTWSAREDRLPSAVWLAVLWLGMLLGFGTDMKRFAHEAPAPHTVIYVHAVVFSVWMLLLTAQVLLVLGNRVAWHKKLGWFSAGWAVLMLVLGPWAAMSSQANVINIPGAYDPQFLSVNLADIVAFAVLLAWGILLRKNPAAHKRMMILSTVALADPGFSRFSGYMHPQEPHSAFVWFWYTFYGNVLLVVLMAGWDWWKGRLMRSFAFGSAFLVALLAWASAVYFWTPWHNLTNVWVTAWARRGW
ncbi:MAG: hypothetical protein V4555_00530 [Acidobacteriota bacterium]